MKKQYLILFTSALFILLFVNQDIGLNVSIFGLVLTGLLVYLNMEKINTQTQKIIVVASVFSCLAFAWYGDFVSFVALALSILFLQFRLQSPQLKLILSLPIIVINAFATSVRFFQFSKWLPAPVNNSHLVKKAIAYFGSSIVITHTGIRVRINPEMNIVEILPLLFGNIAHIHILVFKVGANDVGFGN